MYANVCIPITDHGLNFKRNILLENKRRFNNIGNYQMLAIATILDTDLKDYIFYNQGLYQWQFQLLILQYKQR